MSDDAGRSWAAGVLMGSGFTFAILGVMAFNHTIDPTGSLLVGVLIFAVGLLLKRRVAEAVTEVGEP